MNSLLCFIFLATFSLLPIPSFVEAKTHSSFSFTIDLIHRDSSLSPFYNHSATPGDLARNYVHRAIARANYFRDAKKIRSSDGNRLQSLLNPTGSAYLMKLYVGTPKVEVLALADTGSDLNWIQCLPCQYCYPHKYSIFNSSKSSTYIELSCSARRCLDLYRDQDQSPCQRSNKCLYESPYRDDSFSNGVLANDTFTFDSTDGQLVPFPNFTFGCGHQNKGIFDKKSAGLAGLGGGPLSLVSQLGDQIQHKFSYCLQPITAKSSSKLRFGTGSVEGIVSTPLFPSLDPNNHHYYLNLEGVSVGNKKIVNTQSATGEGDTVIDSGTTVTVLNSRLYSDVEAAVQEAVGLKPVQEQSGDNLMCYHITSFNEIPEMTMVFHFTGADVTLKKLNIFLMDDDLERACLAMIPTNIYDDQKKLSIFGNVAQINFRVEYDLAKKQVSFAPADCTQF